MWKFAGGSLSAQAVAGTFAMLWAQGCATTQSRFAPWVPFDMPPVSGAPIAIVTDRPRVVGDQFAVRVSIDEERTVSTDLPPPNNYFENHIKRWDVAGDLSVVAVDNEGVIEAATFVVTSANLTGRDSNVSAVAAGESYTLRWTDVARNRVRSSVGGSVRDATQEMLSELFALDHELFWGADRFGDNREVSLGAQWNVGIRRVDNTVQLLPNERRVMSFNAWVHRVGQNATDGPWVELCATVQTPVSIEPAAVVEDREPVQRRQRLLLQLQLPQTRENPPLWLSETLVSDQAGTRGVGAYEFPYTLRANWVRELRVNNYRPAPRATVPDSQVIPTTNAPDSTG